MDEIFRHPFEPSEHNYLDSVEDYLIEEDGVYELDEGDYLDAARERR
jgi:hypothetical protein